MLITFLLILLPLWMAWSVYDMYRRDLKAVRRSTKLKIGEVETMMQRHKRAIWLHGMNFLIFSLAALLLLGAAGIFILLPFVLVFAAHVKAFELFHRAISRPKRKQVEYSRLADEQHLDPQSTYTVGDDGELIELAAVEVQKKG